MDKLIIALITVVGLWLLAFILMIGTYDLGVEDKVYVNLYESEVEPTNRQCVDQLLEKSSFVVNKASAIKTCIEWGYD